MEHMYELKNTDTIISPSLIYYEEIIRENIKKAIRTAGSPERLWPHVKSHKSKDMVRMQMEYGITKFKTATVAEAEMAAEAGAEKVIYGVEDDLAQFEALSGVCVEHNAVLPMLVDVNMGMNRTGVPIERLEELYRSASSLPGLRLCGMHCYDGNHNNKDAAVSGRRYPFLSLPCGRYTVVSVPGHCIYNRCRVLHEPAGFGFYTWSCRDDQGHQPSRQGRVYHGPGL